MAAASFQFGHIDNKVLIVEMKAEIAEAQRLKDLGESDGRPQEEKSGKRTEK